MGAIAAAIPTQQGQGGSMIHRVTRDGRDLWYRLDVIQQPERARACGSGPKSSADRRPVDPPPVVELRIFEGPQADGAHDVTFQYNANFFLFATLEHARPIAPTRGAPPTPPVLTGMPVSGMAYLDRPQEAGYFLFPDLSVRHEGRYRLTFNLYEETKEAKDMDKETSSVDLSTTLSPAGASFDWRMDVKSDDFNVYSAKKFPGLTESTALSRTVAEQGCRVRIRRDVRMRRRDGKGGGGDFENMEDGYSSRRRQASQTPEVQRDAFRTRSSSNASLERTPYSADVARRPSCVDFPHPPPPPLPPTYPAGPSSSRGHLNFGNPPSATYPPHPYANQTNPQSSPVSPSQPYPPPPVTPTGYGPPQPPVRQPSVSYHYNERPPSQHYSSAQPSPQRESFDMERRTSASFAPLPPMAPRTEADGNLQPARMSSQSISSLMQTPPALASSDAKKAQLPSISSFLEQPLAVSTRYSERQHSVGIPAGPAASAYSQERAVYGAGSKRTHGEALGSADGWRSQNHAREPDHLHEARDGLDDNPLTYRRADGQKSKRHLPPLH